HFPCVKALPSIVARVRRVFDLGADIATIDSHLARDPKLAPLIRKRPGLRAPGDWERETVPIAHDNAPPAWRPWHAYANQHLRMPNHACTARPLDRPPADADRRTAHHRRPRRQAAHHRLDRPRGAHAPAARPRLRQGRLYAEAGARSRRPDAGD